MLIVHVFCSVKPEMVGAFKEATVKNASNSIKEPGVIRFDLLQQQDDPAKFVISEVYKSAEAIAAHKETAHYAEWSQYAEPMLAEPRSRMLYNNIFPEDRNW
ncbi:MAG TPA: antibiotic biosynthesis monooxygenase [Candidatus Humimicrobiaceae bacterium]